MRLKLARFKTLFTRRSFLATLVRMPLIAAFIPAPGFQALAARRAPRIDAHAERTIAAIIDHMLPGEGLPGEGLPGGVALGVDRRIVASADQHLRRSLVEAVGWLDRHARARGATSFLALDHAGQEAALQAARGSHAEGAYAIAQTLRNQALTLYYTHPSILSAFAYGGPPQPGGFPDFQEPPQ